MVKNIFKVLVSNMVVLFTSFINTLIIPKILTIDGYAEYQMFMLYISYVGLMTLGFHSGLFVKYGGKKREEIEKSQFKSEMHIVLVSQVIISCIIIAIAFFIKNELLFLAALCILTSNFVSVYKYLYQAWDEFTKFSIISIFQSVGFSGIVLFVGILLKKIPALSVIYVYIVINAICFAIVFFEYMKQVRGIRAKKCISNANLEIFSVGLLLMLGGAANVIFSSVDKYYIKGLFTNYEFSMYCFAITLLNVMNVFISAIAQPMYLQLANHIDDYEERSKYKEMLLCFGALSGCAYYAVAVIVKYFIPEYLDSLSVVAILFAIFPAVAVINCLYVNLYKATNQVKKYIFTLFVMIICSVVLNAAFVLVDRNYLAITAATTICYYIWYFLSARHFEGLHVKIRDVIYLIGFLLIYFFITRIANVVLGFVLYAVVIGSWSFIIYHKSLMILIRMSLKKVISKKTERN